MKRKLFILLIAVALTVIKTAAQTTGSFTDMRDNNSYKSVKIGSQTWMAENLNFIADSSWCYNDSAVHCKTYGRLYSWNAANKACPTGWHLPADEEWTALTDFLGGEDHAAGKLKSTAEWKIPDSLADNSSGFSAIPGGYRHYGGKFYSIGYGGHWWTASLYGPNSAWKRNMSGYKEVIFRNNGLHDYGFSVRCVKD